MPWEIQWKFDITDASVFIKKNNPKRSNGNLISSMLVYFFKKDFKILKDVPYDKSKITYN
jgi:hypothetical protein